MARFRVYQVQGGGLVVDCQADLLSGLATRFVVPLLAEAEAPRPAERLNPVFTVAGARYVMATQFAATLATAELGDELASLREEEFAISNALDMLLTGY